MSEMAPSFNDFWYSPKKNCTAFNLSHSLLIIQSRCYSYWLAAHGGTGNKNVELDDRRRAKQTIERVPAMLWKLCHDRWRLSRPQFPQQNIHRRLCDLWMYLVRDGIQLNFRKFKDTQNYKCGSAALRLIKSETVDLIRNYFVRPH